MDVRKPTETENLGKTLVSEPLRFVQEKEGLRASRAGEKFGPYDREKDGEEVPRSRLAHPRRVARNEHDATRANQLRSAQVGDGGAQHSPKDLVPHDLVKESSGTFRVLRTLADSQGELPHRSKGGRWNLAVEPTPGREESMGIDQGPFGPFGGGLEGPGQHFFETGSPVGGIGVPTGSDATERVDEVVQASLGSHGVLRTLLRDTLQRVDARRRVRGCNPQEPLASGGIELALDRRRGRA